MKIQQEDTSNDKTFNCPDHVKNLWTNLQAYYTSTDKQFNDIVLITENDQKHFNAHKMILSASSLYFFSLLQSKSRKKKNNKAKIEEIRLKDIDGIVLESILGFIYTASIKLEDTTIRRVLRAAQLFQLKALESACWEFLGDSLSPSNCLSVLSLAEEEGRIELHQKASKFAYMFYEEICIEDEFLELDKKQLKKFIFGADLLEEEVFISLVSWVDHDREKREPLLFDLLLNIRFDCLEPKFIIDNRKLVCKTIECYELICSWLQWHLSPDIPPETTTTPTSPAHHTKLGYVGEDLTVRTMEPDSDWSLWITNQDISSAVSTPMTTLNKAAITIDEKLIVVGGENAGEATNEVLCFDLRTKILKSLPPMKYARSRPGLAAINGVLYVLGGCKAKKWLDSAEKFDFSTNSWHNLPPLSVPFTKIKVAVADSNLIYAVGDNCHTMNCYNPLTNQWNRRSFYIEKSSDFGFAAVAGHLYAVGGCYNGRNTFTVEYYNAVFNFWSVVTECDTRRSAVECVALNGKLIVCEDSNSIWMSCNYVKEFDPRTRKWKTLSPMLHWGLKVGLITM